MVIIDLIFHSHFHFLFFKELSIGHITRFIECRVVVNSINSLYLYIYIILLFNVNDHERQLKSYFYNILKFSLQRVADTGFWYFYRLPFIVILGRSTTAGITNKKIGTDLAVWDS